MNISSSCILLCKWAALFLQLLAISLNVLHHEVLTGQFVVVREVAYHPAACTRTDTQMHGHMYAHTPEVVRRSRPLGGGGGRRLRLTTPEACLYTLRDLVSNYNNHTVFTKYSERVNKYICVCVFSPKGWGGVPAGCVCWMDDWMRSSGLTGHLTTSVHSLLRRWSSRWIQSTNKSSNHHLWASGFGGKPGGGRDVVKEKEQRYGSE